MKELASETSEVRGLAKPALDRIEAVTEVLDTLIDRVKEVGQRFSAGLGV